MSDLEKRITEELYPDVQSGTGLSLHDWAFEMGRKYGVQQVIMILRRIEDTKTLVPDYVHEPQDRGSADEYARTYSPSA